MLTDAIQSLQLTALWSHMEHGYLFISLFVHSFIISVLTATIIQYYYTENKIQDSL